MIVLVANFAGLVNGNPYRVVVTFDVTPRNRGEGAEAQKRLAHKRLRASAGFRVFAVSRPMLPTTPYRLNTLSTPLKRSSPQKRRENC